MLVIIAITGALLIATAVWDVSFRRIPNTLCLSVFCLFLLHIAFMDAWAEIPEHLAIGGGALVVGMIVFALGWFGGGDVKLFAALAFWAGPEHLYSLLIVTSLAGGVLGLIYLVPVIFFKSPLCIIGSNWLFGTLLNKQVPDILISGPKPIELPYGVAIAIGGGVILYEIGQSV